MSAASLGSTSNVLSLPVRAPERTTDVLDALELVLATFPVERVMFTADLEGVATCRVRGSLPRWVIALHMLVAEAVNAAPAGELVTVAVSGDPHSVSITIVDDRASESAFCDFEVALDGLHLDQVRELLEEVGGSVGVTPALEGNPHVVSLRVPLARQGSVEPLRYAA